jgi:hypothetical protein
LGIKDMIRISGKYALVGLAVAASGMGLSPAYAQATRTWVSGVGDDVNPCSRTAPCKTFAGAISKTAAGGEINCLDPGGFGTLTITKSITIDCTGTFGSTLNSGGINGFVINDSLAVSPGTAEVRLRGLSINGAGSTPGLNGIRMIRGKFLLVEDVYIQNQKSGSGISIAPSAGPVKVFIDHVVIADSGTATTGGIDLKPTGGGSAQVTIRNVTLSNNAGAGINAGGGVLGFIEDSGISFSANGINVNGSATLFVNDTRIFANTTTGILSAGGGRVRVANKAPSPQIHLA